MVSPRRTTAAPSACLATLPFSMVRARPPTRAVTECFIVSFFRPERPGRGLAPARLLLAEPEALDQGLVARDVALLEVIEQAAPLADHLEQSAAGVVVLRVR